VSSGVSPGLTVYLLVISVKHLLTRNDWERRAALRYHHVLQPGSIMYASWPVAGDVDEISMRASDFVMETAHDLRIRLKNRMQHVKVLTSKLVSANA